MTINEILLFVGVIMIVAVFASKVMSRYGVPTLVIFMGLGMLLGSEGLGGIEFNDIYAARDIANVALMVIIFSGGFDTHWSSAKKSATLSITLASIGVVFTALSVAIFAYLALGFTLLEGFLLGSIISSTDAASVFAILKAKRLNLKNELAPTLEMESGSNDPMSYLLTILALGLFQGQGNQLFGTFALQILVGLLVGFLVGKVSTWFINHIRLSIDGLYIIIAIAVMIISYSLSTVLLGNGFLSVYLTGIILGNSRIVHKFPMIRFFDGLTNLMQMTLFFTLGLLVFPSQVQSVLIPGLAVALFLTFVGRPLAVTAIMKFGFRRSLSDTLFVSWVGFRGAASIVFAILAIAENAPQANLIFNIVFFVAFFSVLFQGTFLVPIAKHLRVVEPEGTVLKTFTDYSGEVYTEVMELRVSAMCEAAGKSVKDLDLPQDVLILMIKRGDLIIPPKGATEIMAGDLLMLAGGSKEELLRCSQLIRRPKED